MNHSAACKNDHAEAPNQRVGKYPRLRSTQAATSPPAATRVARTAAMRRSAKLVPSSSSTCAFLDRARAMLNLCISGGLLASAAAQAPPVERARCRDERRDRSEQDHRFEPQVIVARAE